MRNDLLHAKSGIADWLRNLLALSVLIACGAIITICVDQIITLATIRPQKTVAIVLSQLNTEPLYKKISAYLESDDTSSLLTGYGDSAREVMKAIGLNDQL